MSVTTHGEEQVRSQRQPDAYLTLVTIFDGTPLRLVNNNVDITSRGDLFTAMPLEISISSDDGETIQSVLMTLDNVTLEMIDWVRTLTTPVSVLFENVFSGNIDVVERSISNMVIQQIEYNGNTITASLGADDDLNQKLPSDKYTALQWAGLY